MESGSQGRSEAEESLVEPAIAGADDIDNADDVAGEDGMDRSCGNIVMPPSGLPELETLDASAFNAANWTHFAAGVMDERGVEAAIQFGHDRSLQLESTFGCNAQNFPLYMLLAVDDHNKGIPIAYLVSSAERVELLSEFLHSVQGKVMLRQAEAWCMP